jgi:hypothetical protein
MKSWPFICILILCCAYVAFLYAKKTKRTVHYVFIVRNQQHMIEGHIRSALLRHHWRPVKLYMTVIDVGSADMTLKVAETLTRHYPLQIVSVDNQEEVAQFVRTITDKQSALNDLILIRAEC